MSGVLDLLFWLHVPNACDSNEQRIISIVKRWREVVSQRAGQARPRTLW